MNGRHRQQVDAEDSNGGGGGDRRVCVCFDRTPTLGFINNGRPCQAQTLIVKM